MGDAMSKYLSGVGATIQGIQKHGRTAKEALAAGIREAAEIAFQKSQTYVPVRFGHLKGSGKVVEAGVNESGVMAWLIFYGGTEAPYALPVHEISGAHHAPPTCYKYLERAVRETRNQQSYAIKRRMQGKTTGVMHGGGQSSFEDLGAVGDLE